MIGNECINVTKPEVALELFADRSNFKLYMGDTGLLVTQMLRAAGHDLYFHEYMYTPKGTAGEKKYEIDFMTVKKKKISPIEVKSSGYTSHKSFDYLVEKYQLKMQGRYIIYTKDLKYQDGILHLTPDPVAPRTIHLCSIIVLKSSDPHIIRLPQFQLLSLILFDHLLCLGFFQRITLLLFKISLVGNLYLISTDTCQFIPL